MHQHPYIWSASTASIIDRDIHDKRPQHTFKPAGLSGSEALGEALGSTLPMKGPLPNRLGTTGGVPQLLGDAVSPAPDRGVTADACASWLRRAGVGSCCCGCCLSARVLAPVLLTGKDICDACPCPPPAPLPVPPPPEAWKKGCTRRPYQILMQCAWRTCVCGRGCTESETRQSHTMHAHLRASPGRTRHARCCVARGALVPTVLRSCPCAPAGG